MESTESKLLPLLNSEDDRDVEMALEILKNLNLEKGKTLEYCYEISTTSAYRLLGGTHWRLGSDGTLLIRDLKEKIRNHTLIICLYINDSKGGVTQWWNKVRKHE